MDLVFLIIKFVINIRVLLLECLKPQSQFFIISKYSFFLAFKFYIIFLYEVLTKIVKDF